MIYYYIFLNKYTIKLQYSIHWLKKTIDVVIKPGFKIFFFSSVVNGYQKILIKKFDYNKSGFLIPNEQ